MELKLRLALNTGLDDLGVSLSAHTISQLHGYLALLYKWNSAYNLTAVRAPEQMISQHILDSLTLLPFIKGQQCLDVGTGAGLPGMILAMANPAQQWCLLDSNGKKTRFLQQALIELQLTNIEVVQSRIEDYIPTVAISTIVSRAYTALADYVRSVSHLIHPDVNIVAMKGRLLEQELQAFFKLALPHRIQALSVPGIEADRHVVIVDFASNMT